MDFYTIRTETNNSKNKAYDFKVYCSLKLLGSKDVIVKRGKLYSFWYNNQWHNNEYLLYKIIDKDILEKVNEIKDNYKDSIVIGEYLNDSRSNMLSKTRNYIKDMEHSNLELDTKIIFSDHEITRDDYASFKLPYSPKEGSTTNFDKMFTKLYSPEELEKILWVIGAIATGGIRQIQKMLYLFGEKRTGKGTVISLIEKMFSGYTSNIDLSSIISGYSHATAQLVNKPILIDADSKVSKGKDVTQLMKIVSHEEITVNPKGKEHYGFLFEGIIITASNDVIKMDNIDSGMVSRPLVVHPTGYRHPTDKYNQYKEGMKFEYSAIVYRAIEVFNKLGIGYYDNDFNIEMLSDTDIIHSFVEENFMILKDGTTLRQVGELYKLYLEDFGMSTNGFKRDIKAGLMRYYRNFYPEKMIEGKKYKNVFDEFILEKVSKRLTDTITNNIKDEIPKYEDFSSSLDLLSLLYKDQFAQYATSDGLPSKKWDKTTTILSDLDTTRLHYVKMPENHIVIDFDIKDSNGNKSLIENIKASSYFPKTYGELSKSGNGIHLHYIYIGDINELSYIYDNDIEIKIFKGNSSLRRKFTYSNGYGEISSIKEGLPLKEKRDILYKFDKDFILDEKKLRLMIMKNLRKEYHSNTGPSMDYIKYLVDEANKSGVEYDITDFKQKIINFAMSSTNQAKRCLEIANSLNYSTKINDIKIEEDIQIKQKEELYFFDIEVFKNLNIICYKKYGEDKVYNVINPDSKWVEDFVKNPIVGFNNYRYDNHILYGILLGESPEEIYSRSNKIINTNDGQGLSTKAYNLSYTDVYNFSSDKKSLKKWEIELELNYDELEWDWTEPIPDKLIQRAIEYCENDVIATEKVFDHLISDYNARCILSKLSGLSPNATTQQHTAKIIFGNDKRPQDKFTYADLSIEFPGYSFDGYTSKYKGLNPSEGGYVYSVPGIYENVKVFDITSMHPHSIIFLNYFGPYTQKYKDLVDSRILIKHGKYEEVGKLFDGALKPYLGSKEDASDLSYSLKVAINIPYGMTSAKFDNVFKHPENIDNIIAKRGALFMIDLQLALEEKGVKVIHIKTDSIKIGDITPEIESFIYEFAKEYGYNFEEEDTYEKFILFNKSVYIGKQNAKWEAKGAQFQVPYIYKSLLSKEEIILDDYIISKSAQDPIYLVYENNEEFLGKNVKIYPSLSGADVFRKKNNKLNHISGTKGYKWKSAKDIEKEDIDMTYFKDQINDCLKDISDLNGGEPYEL